MRRSSTSSKNVSEQEHAILNKDLTYINEGAERALIGTVLADTNAWAEVGHLGPEHFTSTVPRTIWRYLKDNNGNAGKDGATAYLANANLGALVETAGGPEATIEILLKEARGARQAPELASVITDCWISRSVQRALRYGDTLLKSDKPAKERLEELLRNVDQIQIGPSGSTGEFTQGIADFEKQTRELRANKGKIPGIRLGFTDLDDVLVGLKGGNLLLVASNTGEGKSIFAGNAAVNIATTPQDDGRLRKVAYVGLKMSADEMAGRFALARAKVPMEDYIKGRTTKEQDAKLDAALEWMKAALHSEHFVYKSAAQVQSISDIVHTCRYLVRRDGVQVVCIDYVQQVMTKDKEKRTEMIEDVISKIKLLALELNVPIVAVSQITREVMKERSGRPRLTDLAASASLERYADYVLGLWRPARHLERPAVRNGIWKDVCVFDLLKGRFRPEATCYLGFDGGTARFYNLDRGTIKTLESKTGDLEAKAKEKA